MKKLTPWLNPVHRGRQKQSLISCVLMAAFASVSFAIAEPISVLYWDGTSLIPIDPSAGYVIPAGATYAIDEMDGVGLVLAASPGTSAPPDGTVPGPNVSNPSITTPSGNTFEIPDAGNVSSIVQNGGSVTVTYNDGATATVPGTYVPPGSSPPAPAPAQEPFGPPAPGPNPPLQSAVANDLLNDAWIAGFLGGALKPADVPTDLSSHLFDGTVLFQGNTDTIVQRMPVPETSSTLALLLMSFGIVALGTARGKVARCRRT